MSLFIYVLVDRKQELDEALVNIIVKDLQPFSIVEDSGFRDFVALLDPSYTLPSRRALKNMVVHKYEEEKAKAAMQSVEAVGLTSDMWTSINMEAYLAVTCHYVDDSAKLATVLLGVVPFPISHTADNISAAKKLLMQEWGIEGKVTSIVTDAGANMVASVRNLNLRHVICFAHALNLVVKKSLDATPGLADIRARSQKVVAYFKSSTTAKKLREVQEQMQRPLHKLIQEVDTRWNSTYHMLQRIFEERQAVGAALATLRTDVTPLSSEDYESITACLKLLAPFYRATVELSEEKRVSGSKIIPMTKMLMIYLFDSIGKTSHTTAKQLGENMIVMMQNKFDSIEKNQTALTHSTLLDPRFKTIGFYKSIKCTGSS
ncbi:hypothetical protein ACEWY4_022891 [Coilia grayii]|uniref:Uncharacterized protein n=1 Tax=Coilia grayii TaxID=363190 RepID=A0ABD1J1G4_9TELE